MLLYFKIPRVKGFGMIISKFARTIYERHVEVYTSTGRSRMGIFKNHIEPIFGNMAFNELSKVQIYDWRNSLLIRGYKPAMINKIQVIFGQIIKLAHDLDVAKVRREDLGFTALKVSGQPETYLKRKQMQELAAACATSSNSSLFQIVQILALTGARKREVLDLKWKHVFLDDQYFLVPKAKNGSPRKVILNEDARNILRNRLQKQSKLSQFVFPNPKTGNPYGCIYHSWNEARTKVGLKSLRIHDLRHSFASALVNQGISIYDVQQLLGHQSIKTTQRYAHLDDNKLKSSANQVGSYYSLN